jgi:hypothetical protein
MISQKNITRAVAYQWSTRPYDQRFLTLTSMHDACMYQDRYSQDNLTQIEDISFRVGVTGPYCGDLEAGSAAYNEPLVSLNGEPGLSMTNWSFLQMCKKINTQPKWHYRQPPNRIVEDFNYHFQRAPNDEFNFYSFDDQIKGKRYLKAVLGKNYGRVSNREIVHHLIEKFGDGINGQWTRPHVRGALDQNSLDVTTFFAGDRDMWVFMTDENSYVEIPNRRNSETGRLSRGFIVWNSEVGSRSLGIQTFYFDHMCNNRLIMGVKKSDMIRISHFSTAPDKFISELQPFLADYTASSTDNVTRLITEARQDNILKDGSSENYLREKLGFSKKYALRLNDVHMLEEERPIETRWDCAVAITANARNIHYQNERVNQEAVAGGLLAA